MKLLTAAAALIAAALPFAPALAHCRTAHRSVAYHATAHRAAFHHRALRAACACRVRSRYAHAAPRWRYLEARWHPLYPVYAPPRIVTLAYARPYYRRYRPIYPLPYYRPRPLYFEARFGGFPGHHFYGAGFRRHRFGWR
jgi:hypothetical protein